MKKLTVLNFFGGDRGAQARVAKALGVSTAAVSKWPEDLPFSVLGRLADLQPKAWQKLKKLDSEKPLQSTQ